MNPHLLTPTASFDAMASLWTNQPLAVAAIHAG